MNYGKLYQVVEFKDETVDKINEIISSSKLTWESGTIQEGQQSSIRNTDVTYLHNKELLDGMMWMCGDCLLYTSPSPRDGLLSRMPSSA